MEHNKHVGNINQVKKMPKKTNEQSSFSEINQNLHILNNRISSLEKMNKEFESKIESMEKKARYESHSDSAEVKKLRDDAVEIKKKIKSAVIYLQHLVNELKHTAKKEEIDILKRKINRFTPYDLATRRDANKIIEEVIEQ